MRSPAFLLVAPTLLAQTAPLPLFHGKAYRPEVPRPALEAAYTPQAALVDYLRALAAAAPDRVRLETLNTTEEGRPQPFLVIASPANLARLAALKAANARLADPRTCTEDEARALVRTQPVFVWLGYSLHGSEASGSEAALAVAYHFAACKDPDVAEQLDKVVLLLDPTQNPDGRERHVQAVREALQGTNPPDPQDAQNQARWPGGRGNHRLFDLNRDWAWQTQGETRAKVAALLGWNPQVTADHHEMQPERNYFFPPNALPIHDAIPGPFAGPWQTTFGRALARAFEAHGRPYFTRDRFDAFYPSYGDTWPSLHGAVGLTFENPNSGGLAYQRKDGQLLTLALRVRQHVLASLATVATAARFREDLLKDFHQVRRERMSKKEKAGAFLLAEGPRTRELVDLLQRNGIEVSRTTEALTTSGLAYQGPGQAPDRIPEGSCLVALDQPNGPMAQALLEREARMPARLSYDSTGWSLPLVFHTPAWYARTRPAVGTGGTPAAPAPFPPPPRWAYLLPPGQAGGEALLAALLQEGFKVWAAAEAFTLHGHHFPAGTRYLPVGSNDPARLQDRLKELAAGHPVLGADTAMADGGADPTGPSTLSLRLPKIAVLVDRPVESTAAGAVIHTLRTAGLPFTQLRAERLATATLQDYTHVVLADDGRQGRGWKQVLGEAAGLKAWIQAGGTLVAMEGGTVFASLAGLTETPLHFLSRRAEEAWLKEKDPKQEPAKAKPEDLVRPWSERPDEELRESIPGTLLKVLVDPSHPLAWGLPQGEMAVLNSGNPILELSRSRENPLHYPKGSLKLSGVLPVELESRLHLTAYVTRERRKQGTVILFAGDPLFRGISPMTTRVFLNALFFGACTGRGPED